MPKLLLDMLDRVVASAPDMSVVGRTEENDLAAAATRMRADVILVGEEMKPRPGEYAKLLIRHPRLKVLAITDDGKTGTLHEMRPQRFPLGEISADSLRDAIRGRHLEDAGDEHTPSSADAQTLPR